MAKCFSVMNRRHADSSSNRHVHEARFPHAPANWAKDLCSAAACERARAVVAEEHDGQGPWEPRSMMGKDRGSRGTSWARTVVAEEHDGQGLWKPKACGWARGFARLRCRLAAACNEGILHLHRSCRRKDARAMSLMFGFATCSPGGRKQRLSAMAWNLR